MSTDELNDNQKKLVSLLNYCLETNHDFGKGNRAAGFDSWVKSSYKCGLESVNKIYKFNTDSTDSFDKIVTKFLDITKVDDDEGEDNRIANILNVVSGFESLLLQYILGPNEEKDFFNDNIDIKDNLKLWWRDITDSDIYFANGIIPDNKTDPKENELEDINNYSGNNRLITELLSFYNIIESSDVEEIQDSEKVGKKICDKMLNTNNNKPKFVFDIYNDLMLKILNVCDDSKVGKRDVVKNNITVSPFNLSWDPNSFNADKDYEKHQVNGNTENDIRKSYVATINKTLKPKTREFINIIPVINCDPEAADSCDGFITENCGQLKTRESRTGKPKYYIETDNNCIYLNVLNKFLESIRDVVSFDEKKDNVPFILLVKTDSEENADIVINSLPHKYYIIPESISEQEGTPGHKILITSGYSVSQLSSVLTFLKNIRGSATDDKVISELKIKYNTGGNLVNIKKLGLLAYSLYTNTELHRASDSADDKILNIIGILLDFKKSGDWGLVQYCKQTNNILVTKDALCIVYALINNVNVIFDITIDNEKRMYAYRNTIMTIPNTGKNILNLFKRSLKSSESLTNIEECISLINAESTELDTIQDNEILVKIKSIIVRVASRVSTLYTMIKDKLSPFNDREDQYINLITDYDSSNSYGTNLLLSSERSDEANAEVKAKKEQKILLRVVSELNSVYSLFNKIVDDWTQLKALYDSVSNIIIANNPDVINDYLKNVMKMLMKLDSFRKNKTIPASDCKNELISNPDKKSIILNDVPKILKSLYDFLDISKNCWVEEEGIDVNAEDWDYDQSIIDNDNAEGGKQMCKKLIELLPELTASTVEEYEGANKTKYDEERGKNRCDLKQENIDNPLFRNLSYEQYVVVLEELINYSVDNYENESLLDEDRESIKWYLQLYIKNGALFRDTNDLSLYSYSTPARINDLSFVTTYNNSRGDMKESLDVIKVINNLGDKYKLLLERSLNPYSVNKNSQPNNKKFFQVINYSSESGEHTPSVKTKKITNQIYELIFQKNIDIGMINNIADILSLHQVIYKYAIYPYFSPEGRANGSKKIWHIKRHEPIFWKGGRDECINEWVQAYIEGLESLSSDLKTLKEKYMPFAKEGEVTLLFDNSEEFDVGEKSCPFSSRAKPKEEGEEEEVEQEEKEESQPTTPPAQLASCRTFSSDGKDLCQCMTKTTGRQCKKQAIEGSKFCRIHIDCLRTCSSQEAGSKNLDFKISELEKFIINEGNYDLPQEVLEDLINID